jgi:hypothetical protein
MAKLDGTGQGSVPSKEALTSGASEKPENPPAPLAGSRGGEGPKVVGGSTTPLGK